MSDYPLQGKLSALVGYVLIERTTDDGSVLRLDRMFDSDHEPIVGADLTDPRLELGPDERVVDVIPAGLTMD